MVDIAKKNVVSQTEDFPFFKPFPLREGVQKITIFLGLFPKLWVGEGQEHSMHTIFS